MSSPNSSDTSQLIYRSSPILASYLVFAAALAFNACRTIFTRYQARQKNNDWAAAQSRANFLLFAVLASLSLASTWYYMFAFFAHTYRNWEARSLLSANEQMELSLVTKLELWLQNTELFREAWETVIETPVRFWWSGQIFLWTTGWSVFLGVMGMWPFSIVLGVVRELILYSAAISHPPSLDLYAARTDRGDLIRAESVLCYGSCFPATAAFQAEEQKQRR